MRAFVQKELGVFSAQNLWSQNITYSVLRDFYVWFFLACGVMWGLAEFPQSKLFLDVTNNLISSGIWNFFGIVGMFCIGVSIAIPTWEKPRKISVFFLGVAFVAGASTLGVLFIDLIEIYIVNGINFNGYKEFATAFLPPILYVVVFILNAFVGVLLAIAKNNRFWVKLSAMNFFFRIVLATGWLLATSLPLTGYL